MALVGYLGEGSSDRFRRLHESVALNRWIEILVTDILDQVPAPGGGEATAGQSVIWVRRNADIT